MTDDEFLAQYSVKPGVAASVSRNTRSHVHGHGETGAFNDAKIRTFHETVEQCILLTDDGAETPITLSVNEPFLREGGRYALVSAAGRPVEVLRISDGSGYYLGKHNDGVPSSSPVVLPFIIGLAIIIISYMFRYDLMATTLLLWIVGAFLIFVGVNNDRKNKKRHKVATQRQKLREGLISDTLESLRQSETKDHPSRAV